ncbi:MAG: hypothetical protein ACRDBY_14160 [Cetobacterium sp.]
MIKNDTLKGLIPTLCENLGIDIEQYKKCVYSSISSALCSDIEDAKVKDNIKILCELSKDTLVKRGIFSNEYVNVKLEIDNCLEGTTLTRVFKSVYKDECINFFTQVIMCDVANNNLNLSIYIE